MLLHLLSAGQSGEWDAGEGSQGRIPRWGWGCCSMYSIRAHSEIREGGIVDPLHLPCWCRTLFQISLLSWNCSVLLFSSSCLQGPARLLLVLSGGVPGLVEGVSRLSGQPRFLLPTPAAASCLPQIGYQLSVSRILPLSAKRKWRISGICSPCCWPEPWYLGWPGPWNPVSIRVASLLASMCESRLLQIQALN